MNICILGVRYKASAGGMYAYQRNVKERLEARGHVVHMIAPEVGVEHANDEMVHKAWVFGFYPAREFMRKIVFGATSFNLIRSLHKAVKFDLVYTMGAYGLNAFLIKKILRIPVVNHAPFPSMHRLKSERGWKKWCYLYPLGLLEYPALRFSDKIVILSEAFRDAIHKLCPPVADDKIVVIPNGVDIVDSRQDIDCAKIREKYGVSANTILYLYVGWVTKKKGIYDLLEAFYMIDKRDKKLIIVGPIDKEITGIEKREYENVLFTGYIAEREKEELFRCADVFVFPSHSEGQPFTVLEAMSYGLPVITTRKDGMTDQVDNGVTGYLVPPHNPVLLAQKMETITTRGYKKMGALGREKAKREFSWDSVIDKTVEVFEEVVVDAKT